MAQDFDLIVIGTGSAGITAAFESRKAGWTVAIIDELPFGGTCALRGCDPKKVLVGAAEVTDWAWRMHAIGVIEDKAKIDWPSLQRFKRTFTDPVPATLEKQFSDASIQAFHGTATFVDRTTLRVRNETLRGKHFLIASGSEPMKLNVPGEELLITSDKFLDLEQLPSPIVFIGGGFISFEFAHVAARAGAQAIIIEQADHVLRGFDQDLVGTLLKATQDIGIQVHLGTTLKSLDEHGDGIVAVAERGGARVEFAGAMVVHGSGRVPALDALNLDVAHVERTKKGVKVNEYQQSASNPAVYAAGDSSDNGVPQLTPVASRTGDIACHNIMHGNSRTADFSGLAYAVYAIPTLASAGLTEEEAREKGLRFKVNTSDMSSWYSSRRVNEKYAAYKVLLDEETHVPIGAHFLGQSAEELANVFALAIRAKIPAQTLRDTLFDYPTASSNILYMV